MYWPTRKMEAFSTKRRVDPVYPQFTDLIPDRVIRVGEYELRFARTYKALDDIARLRFEVFNLELNEGFDASYVSGRDEDPFDRVCHHLMISERTAGVVGTYRLQTREMAEGGGLGFYSATEFDLSSLPEEVKAQGVELGRACIAKTHRSLKVLYLLWRGIGLYLTWNGRRYVFGCSSLTSQNPAEGIQIADYFEKKGYNHPTISVSPREDYVCQIERNPSPLTGKPEIPRLMRVYLSMGARVCSPPALDRSFKTIDYFTLFDTQNLTPQAQAYFMPGS